ncbi:MAG: hypothetical protein J3K34DRAFT_410000 [Monoraphidium minutum]|nr:MAG: hypothetical protein J3K34DRAFT_410000 [Monoraphidium minutum]
MGPSRNSKARCYPRVNYALLVLCYLEVVLWTACLLSSTAATAESVAGHGYLQRETGNLKCFASRRGSGASPLVDVLPPPPDLHTQLEHWRAQQQQFEARSELGCTCSVHREAELGQLRALLLETKGLPAPFTGIAAID